MKNRKKCIFTEKCNTKYNANLLLKNDISSHILHVLIYKKGDKTDCSNYTGVSLLPTTYRILSNILLSRLTPYAEEITGVSSMWISTQQVDY